MRALAKVVLATAALAVIPGVSTRAQSLGEVAARTQKEKEAKARPAKVFTEADLRKPATAGSVSSPGSSVSTDGVPSAGRATDSSAAPGASPAPGPSPAPGSSVDGKPAAEPSPKPKTPEEERAELTAAWREKLVKAQADVTGFTDMVSKLQAALNDNTLSQYGSGRAEVATRLAEAQKELASANQAVADLQEEGRRAGLR